MKKYAAESMGTFMLVFAGTGAIVANHVSNGAVTHVGVALTFGLVVMAAIYSVGDVSGAHLNPAVTIGFWASGRFSGRQVAPYIAAQILGAVVASGCVRIIYGNHVSLGATLPSIGWKEVFLLEVILTAILMYVILHVSSGAKEKGIMAGAAIGGVVAFEAMFAGPASGASMNPARSFAPAVVSGNMNWLWIYLVTPVIGALLAVVAYKITQLSKDSEASDPHKVRSN
jgi:MIP family channel proteins